MARAQAQAVSWEDMAPVIEAVERNVPTDERLGHIVTYNEWIYPLYGPGLTRRLVKLPREGLFAAAERQDLEAIVVVGSVPKVARGWRAIHFGAVKWTLIVR